MAEQEVHEIVIIKHRRDHDEHAHHGGVWKIAYADFMTAMMAFFLVLWLLNSTNKEARISILNYFNPIKLADASMTRKGIIDPKSAQPAGASEGDKKEKGEQTGDKHGENGLFAPLPSPDDKAAKPATDSRPQEGAKLQPAGRPQGNPKPQEGAAPVGSKLPSYSEGQLFDDPQRVLAEISVQPQAASPPMPARPAAPAAARPAQGGSAAVAYRDPFESTAPQLAADAAAAAASPALPAAMSPASTPPAALPAPIQPSAPAPGATPASAPGPAPAKAVAQDDAASAPAGAAAADATKLQADIAKALTGELAGQPAPGIDVQATSEGVLISLTDEYDFGMFAIGSAEPQAKLVKIMEKIAQILKGRAGPIVIRGHTDGRAYKTQAYDNWRLSADRAQMARFMLLRGGLDDKRFEAVEGYADRRLKVPGDPAAAQNRRIEILLRKDKS